MEQQIELKRRSCLHTVRDAVRDFGEIKTNLELDLIKCAIRISFREKSRDYVARTNLRTDHIKLIRKKQTNTYRVFKEPLRSDWLFYFGVDPVRRTNCPFIVSPHEFSGPVHSISGLVSLIEFSSFVVIEPNWSNELFSIKY